VPGPIAPRALPVLPQRRTRRAACLDRGYLRRTQSSTRIPPMLPRVQFVPPPCLEVAHLDTAALAHTFPTSNARGTAIARWTGNARSSSVVSGATALPSRPSQNLLAQTHLLGAPRAHSLTARATFSRHRPLSQTGPTPARPLHRLLVPSLPGQCHLPQVRPRLVPE
jgi:hypothetical protein